MREIKFRAWDKENKQLYTNAQCAPRIFLGDSDKFEIMQYTGLKDKNDKEIYEGDIVSFALPDNQWSDGQEVKFNRGSFVTPCGGVFSLGFLKGFESLKLLKVIGNIYENPELVKA